MKSKYLLVMPLVIGTVSMFINVKITNVALINDTTKPITKDTFLVMEERFVESKVKAEPNVPNSIYSETRSIKSMKHLSKNEQSLEIDEAQTEGLQTVSSVKKVNKDNTVSLDSVSMVNLRGVKVNTDEVRINTDALMKMYGEISDSPAWDIKEKIDIVEVLWEFLVNQNNVAPINAAALIGNIITEGKFAEQQGTGLVMSNIEQARQLLGGGRKGYGIVQWTHSSRQKVLLKYYELAHDIYPKDWDRAKVTAECAMLIEEVKAYGVFEDITKGTSIEDATGRVCLKYESYRNCNKQWAKQNGSYKLISGKGSNGYERLTYAESVYEYFMN